VVDVMWVSAAASAPGAIDSGYEYTGAPWIQSLSTWAVVPIAWYGEYAADAESHVATNPEFPYFYDAFDSVDFTISPPPAPTISGPDTLWWFDGEDSEYWGEDEDGPSFPIRITLTSSQADTQWSIVSGSDKITLTTTQGPQTTIVSLAPSGVLGDIEVQATTAGGSTQKNVTVRVPHYLDPIGTATTSCDITFGYLTLTRYQIRDQFGTVLSGRLPINEKWTTPLVIDYMGSNWRLGTEVGATTNVAAQFGDTIGAENVFLPPNPWPLCMGETTDIVHWGQDWRVGSSTIGSGRRVQRNVLQKDLGQGIHRNVVSPP
jgi:hypothetical protein